MLTQKEYTKILLHQMHPDEVAFELSYREQKIKEMLDDRTGMEARQEFWLVLYDGTGGDERLIPYNPSHTSQNNITQYRAANASTGATGSEIDTELTKTLFAKVIQWATASPRNYRIEKEYTDRYFNIFIFGVPGFAPRDATNRFDAIEIYASRESVCRKVITGQKVVPAAPEKIVDEVEWVCEKVSFLNIDTDENEETT